jgi:hypothetical protein
MLVFALLCADAGSHVAISVIGTATDMASASARP